MSQNAEVAARISGDIPGGPEALRPCTSQDNDGNERELQGRAANDLEVTVDIEADTESMVSVNAFAQRNTVNWERD